MLPLNEMIETRSATLENAEEIVELLLEGAQAGSFDPTLLEESMRSKLGKDVESIITKKRRTDENLAAYALAFLDGDEFAGFVIISDMPPQIPGLELYGFYLTKPYRGSGHGTKLLQKIIEHVRPDCSNFYVRCRPESKAMYHLAEKSGFSNVGVTEVGAHIMHKQMDISAFNFDPFS